MLTKIKSYLQRTSIALVLFLSNGCTVMAVADKVDNSLGAVEITEIKQGYSDKNTVYVCVDGAIGNNSSEFWINIPIKFIASHRDSVFFTEENFPVWGLGKKHIVKAPCITPPFQLEHHRAIVSEIYQGDISSFQVEMNSIMRGKGISEAVFLIKNKDEDSSVNLSYINLNMNFRGDKGIVVEAEEYYRFNSYLWHALVYPALLVDIVALPVTLPMWLNYTGSH